MAKSARASRIKANKARLRETIFAPADTARAQRLSERLIAAAKVQKEAQMEVEAEKVSEGVAERMDVEADGKKVGGVEGGEQGIKKKRGNAARIKRRQTSRHAVVFPSLRKGAKRGGKVSKK